MFETLSQMFVLMIPIILMGIVSPTKVLKIDVCDFFEAFLILPNGEPFRLYPAQRKILKKAFERDKKTGLRLFNAMLVGQIKKSGKSTVMAGLVLFFCLGDGERYAEVIIVATTREQARNIVFLNVWGFIERNPVLKNLVTRKTENRIELSNGAKILVLSSEAFAGHGYNPNAIIIDEAWTQTNKEMEAIFVVPPTRREPMLIMFTYAGYLMTSNNFLWNFYRRGVTGEDKRLFFYWSHKPEAPWITQEYLDEQRMRLPENLYLRMYENRWVSDSSKLLTLEMIERAICPSLSQLWAGV